MYYFIIAICPRLRLFLLFYLRFRILIANLLKATEVHYYSKRNIYSNVQKNSFGRN